MIAATLVLAVLVGVSLGLLGGGGSILLVPVLVYVAGQDPKAAIAMSLLVVGITSAAGMLAHARAGRVRWRTGAIFGAAGMAGAYGGGRLAAFVPGTWLLIGFAVMAGLTAAAMLRGRRTPPRPEAVGHEQSVVRIVAEGVVVGAVTGMVGAGGGFLVVPALALLGGLPMASAVGTSLLVIALKSGAGLLGYLASTTIDWRLAAAVTAAAVVGSLAGGRLAGRVPEQRLRQTFGWFVAAMAAFMLLQEAPAGRLGALATAPVTWTVAALVGVGVALLVRRRRRRGTRPHDDAEPVAAREDGADLLP
ncbi:sulfite exporter TauE/SafE family protein [Egicoccus sp. AB-alg2]|uniref:sulfite exporter TauE/SafE family protein n=1 Tax=Egicoccus sp. AB-alg2 TaxID=3242693 RepID=UPI00359DAA8D